MKSMRHRSDTDYKYIKEKWFKDKTQLYPLLTVKWVSWDDITSWKTIVFWKMHQDVPWLLHCNCSPIVLPQESLLCRVSWWGKKSFWWFSFLLEFLFLAEVMKPGVILHYSITSMYGTTVIYKNNECLLFSVLTMLMVAACIHLSLTDILHPKRKMLQCQNHIRCQWWLLQRDVVIQHDGGINTLELTSWRDRATKANDFGYTAMKLDGISFCLD